MDLLMDGSLTPLAIGGLIVALAAAVALFTKLSARDEDAFEKAKAENKFSLLNDEDEEEKKKAKKRPTADKKKKKTAENSTSAPVHEEKSPVPSAVKPKKEATPVKEVVEQKKETKKAEKSNDAVVEAKKFPSPSTAKKPSPPLVPSPAKEDEEPAGEFLEARPKNKKKNKAAPVSSSPPASTPAKKEEAVEAPSAVRVEPAVHDMAPAAPVAAPSTSSSKPAKAAVKDLKELDSDKVLTRISGIEEVEPEYISFLVSYFHDSSNKLSAATGEVASLLSKVDEATRAVAAAKANSQRLEADLVGQKKVTEQLALKASAATSTENQLKNQLGEKSTEVERLKKEATSLKKSLETATASVVVPPTPSQPDQSPILRAEIEKLKAEVHTSQQRAVELEKNLRQSEERTSQEKKQIEQNIMLQKSKEDEVVGRDVLLAEAKQNLKVLGDRLTEIEKKNTQLTTRNGDCEHTIAALKEDLQQQEKMHESSTQSLKEMIEELNKEVLRFEDAKADQAATLAKLSAKEAEINEKNSALAKALAQINDLQGGHSAAASDTEARLVSLNKTHAEEVAALSQRIYSLESELATEKAREIIIPANEPVVEEVVELKKSSYLDAAPPSTVEADLRNEVVRLNGKNEELRARNHAIVDQLTEMEKRFVATHNGSPAPSSAKKETAAKKAESFDDVVAERRLVASTLSPLVSSAPELPANVDAKAYKSWLSSVAAQLKEAQSQSKTPAPKKETKKTSTDSGEVERLRAENENYMLALAEVTDELGNIATLHAEREASYAACAAELQALKGGKRESSPPLEAGDSPPPSSATPSPRPSSTSISPTQSRLLDELRACETIKMQIASLRAAIDTVPCPSEAPAPSSPPTGSHSEDDGSWEVVA